MTSAPVGVDPVVRTALQHLPVPDHEPGFWERLDVALGAEPSRSVDEPALAVGPPVAAATPERPDRTVFRPDVAAVELRSDPSRALFPPALRSRSNLVLAVVALVAAVVVVVAGLTLVRQRSGTSSDGIGGTNTSATSFTTVVEDGPAPSAGRAVRSWTAALPSGGAGISAQSGRFEAA